MANDVAKFGVGLDFKKALQGVKTLKSQIRSLNSMQSQMNKVRESGTQARNTYLAGILKKEQKDHETVQKAITAREKEEAKRRNAIYTAASKQKKRLNKQDSVIPSSRTKQTVGNITAPTGAGDMKSFYLKQEKEANDTLKKNNSERSKALRLQEQLGAAMAKDTNALLNKEKARVKALERAKESVRNSMFLMKEAATQAEKESQARVRSQINSAKTAANVREIVAKEKASLRNAQKKSFLMQRMESSSKNIAGNMVSAFAVAAGGAFITKTGQDFESVSNTMLAVSSSAEESGENLKFVKEEAYRLGLGLTESAKGFAKMNAARGAMSLEDTKKAFTGISEMSTLLGLSSEESGRAINALQQMMSKGVVSAEELKLQMGEVLPNAIPLMAKAAKEAGLSVSGTVEEMMELQQKGDLVSSKVLPHFAKAMSDAARNNGGLEKALKSNRVAMNQMNTAIQTASDTIFKSGWSEGLTDLFKSIGELFSENEVFFKSFGKIAGSVFKGLAFVIREVLNPALSALGSILNLVTTSMDAFGDWVVLLLIPLAKYTPLLGLIIKKLGGFKAILGVAGQAVKRFLFPLYLVLGVLEEISEFLSPTGKKTFVGFNIDDLKLPSWLTSKKEIKVKIDEAQNGNNFKDIKKDPVLNVSGQVVMGSEQVGQVVMSTEASRSGISGIVAEFINVNN